MSERKGSGTTSHHAGRKFRNPHHEDSRGFGDFLRWRRERARKEIPPPEAYDFPRAVGSPAADTVTWIGQSTLLVRLGEVSLLTDPHFSSRASPFSWAGPRRAAPPGLPLEALPRIDFVVISHDHYDHLDVRTVRWLVERPGGEEIRWVVPRGLKRWFARKGIEGVEELDWWEKVRIGEAAITAVPVQHWSKRTLFGAFGSLWAGYRVEARGRSFLFIGDSGYSPDFSEIRRRLGEFDLAALPIGAYAPRWFMKPYHMNTAEAVQAHLDLGAPPTVALHWGTFSLADEPLDEPPRLLRAELARRGISEERFRVLRHGETLSLQLAAQEDTDSG